MYFFHCAITDTITPIYLPSGAILAGALTETVANPENYVGCQMNPREKECTESSAMEAHRKFLVYCGGIFKAWCVEDYCLMQNAALSGGSHDPRMTWQGGRQGNEQRFGLFVVFVQQMGSVACVKKEKKNRNKGRAYEKKLLE